MMSPTFRGWILTLAAAVTLLSAGCRSEPAAPAAAPAERTGLTALSLSDACEERLHDWSRPLLFYYALHHRLPPSLEALRAAELDDIPPHVCPVSGQPYLYRPNGLRIPGLPGQVILFDAEPVHGGMRLAVVFVAASETEPLTTRVLPIPESRFAAIPPSIPQELPRDEDE